VESTTYQWLLDHRMKTPLSGFQARTALGRAGRGDHIHDRGRCGTYTRRCSPRPAAATVRK
jgi:hypothetical protein